MGCLMAKECPHRTAVCYTSPPDEGCYVYRYFKEIFNNPTGKWINNELPGWLCSNCKENIVLNIYLHGNYCPNCGAKMKNWGY